MRYTIAVPSLNLSLTRKRSDAAMLAAERAAYDAIAGFAGLDTAWGHKAYAAVKSIDPRKGGMVVIRPGCALYLTPSVS